MHTARPSISGSGTTKMNDRTNIESWVRENIRNLVPYSSARDEFSGSASVYLDANESPFPPLNRYPDPGQKELKEAISSLKGSSPDCLFLGNGSDEGIDLLIRVLCEPGKDQILTVDPTYGMYAVCARINNVERKSVLLRRDFSLDAESVLEAVEPNTKLIFICSPNNPTSNAFERKEILKVIDRAGCMVVVDEAYLDFSGEEGFLSLVPAKKNLVVLQTFSKARGLAGIRLGMLFAHPVLIHYLSSVKYPYNVSSLTIEKALEHLRGKSEIERNVQRIVRQRKVLEGELLKMPFIQRVFHSDANFLLVRLEKPMELYSFLMKRGIIVRDRSKVSLCEGCLRITIGTEEENSRLLTALKKYAAE